MTEYINECMDFPGVPVVENLPADAGETGSFPAPGRSHMLQANSPGHNYWAYTLESKSYNKISHHNEKPTHNN